MLFIIVGLVYRYVLCRRPWLCCWLERQRQQRRSLGCVVYYCWSSVPVCLMQEALALLLAREMETAEEGDELMVVGGAGQANIIPGK